jgi:hypothetical protein
MRDKIKLIINIVLVCVTVKRAFDELHREQRRKRRADAALPGANAALPARGSQ